MLFVPTRRSCFECGIKIHN